MKNYKVLVFLALMVFYSLPTMATVDNKPNSTPAATETNSTELIKRLEEIKTIDKTSITSAEKKTLRKEVRSIKKELKQNGNGVYLSAGAAILIVLLLIIIL